MLFATTSFTGATPVPSWGRISCRLDNEEVAVADGDWEVLQMQHQLLGRLPPTPDAHTHRVDATSAATTEETTGQIESGMGAWDQRLWLDFDPTRDDAYSIDTKGASSFQVRGDAETADAVRVLTVEKIAV
jgi:hypothetical protein